MHSGNSSEIQSKYNRLDLPQNDAPRATSPLLQRIDRIKHGIKATLSGTSKDWLNVQPCVLQGFNSLVGLVQNHDKRLCKIDGELEEMRQTVQILIHDRLLKEERYQLDHAMHSESVTALEKLTQGLHLKLEEEVRSRRQLQREVQRLQRDNRNLKRKCHHQPSNDSKALTGTQVIEVVGEQQEHSARKLYESLMREIRLLRVQWDNYRLDQQGAESESFSKGAPLRSVSDNYCCISPEECRELPFPPQSARWFWMGDGNSHFSEALTRSNGAVGQPISRPIPWEEMRLYDPATACWYIARSCFHKDTGTVFQNGLSQTCPADSALRPLADVHANTTRRTTFSTPLCNDQGARGGTAVGEIPVGFGGMKQSNCFVWVRPRTIRIARAGIYKYTICLLRDTHSSSSFSGGVGIAGESLNNEVLVLYVNHRCVVSLGASNSCVLLHANITATTSSTGARRSMLPIRRCASSSRARKRLSFERFTRPCCEPDQLATSTLSDYIFLPDGAIVQVIKFRLNITSADLMGQGSIGLVRDTITAEQFLNYQEANHRVVHRAFQKCVVPTSKGKDVSFDLTEEERNCVEEFALLYAAFAKKNFLHFTSLYEQHQKEMYEKARLEYMQQQARQNLKKQ